MKFAQPLALFALATQSISAASIPDAHHGALSVLVERAPAAAIVSPDHTLEKRKGGGGRGGSSSGGSSSGGSSSGGGRSGGSRTGASSNSGGATSAGSGAARGLGGGKYYGGGAAVPYSAGGRSPKGISPGLVIAPIALLAIMPGLWLYSTYPYHYNNPYRFRNQSRNATDNNSNNNNRRSLLYTRQSTGANETLPVMCLCQEYSVCGCDENDDEQYLNDLIGNGSYAALNKTLVTVSDVEGKKTLVLNGTLPNGTTAPGGVDDEEGLAVNLSVGKYTGYWAMGLIVLYGVMM